MTLCLGLGNLQKLSTTESLKLVEKAFDLGICRFDSSVNYLHNLAILDTFFRETQDAKVVLKVGSANSFELRNLKRDLEQTQNVNRSNIQAIMLHSTPPTQMSYETLAYLRDYCETNGVPLGISCDNGDLAVASQLTAFQHFMCTNSLIDYANVPILESSRIEPSHLYFKRILANAPWRVMLPKYEYQRLKRFSDFHKGSRINSYEQLFADIFGRRSLTYNYVFVFLLYFRLNFPGATLVFGSTNQKHIKEVSDNYNREIRKKDIAQISLFEQRSKDVYSRHQYLARV